MTITLRTTTFPNATTKNSRLTHTELDANFTSFMADSGSSLVGFLQSGSGAVARTVQAKERDVVSVKDYMTAAQEANVLAGGLNPTVDVTAAVVAAVAAAETSNLRTLVFPAGSYLLTSTVAFPTAFTCEFAGVGRTIFVFRPTAADTMFEVSAGSAVNYNTTFKGGFTCYSDDTTYVKIAVDLVDVSSFDLDGIYVYGSHVSGLGNSTWHDTTNASIGIRTRGREASAIRNYKIVADKPVSIAANPNTAATDGEDMDHWNWENAYVVPISNYCYEVADGLGIMDTSFGGYQAWVGGSGGFKINDTRVAPTVPSRNIKFTNVRTEQFTVAANYAFDLTFTQPVQTLKFANVLMATGSNGIDLDGFDRVILDQVTAGMTSGTSIVTANTTASSVLVMSGCIWTSGGAVTLTGLTQIHAQAYRSASYAAPSDAVYAGQITDTLVNVGKVTVTAANGTEALLVTGTTGDAYQVIPQAAGSGVSRRVLNNGKTDFEPMSDTAETFERRYRTGVGTSAVADQIDTSGQLSVAKRFFPAQDTGAVQTAAGLFAGTGAPNNANGSNGDFYLRGDGTAAGNTVIYHKEGGSWVALTT